MRKLASVQVISKLEPIQNADSIEKATVLGWELVVKKNEFSVGDKCVYCEIDSILPDKPEFEFLKDRKFRIKTIRLRGQISQGICFPLSILPNKNYNVDDDVTDIIGVTKWEAYQEELKLSKQVGKIMYPKWMPQWFQRIIHRVRFIREYYRKNSGQKSFPSLIPKTDETRVQVLQPLLDKYAGTECYITEKLDGSSITVYLINGKFGVCSRNIDLKRDINDKYWNAVLELDLEAKFKRYFKGISVAMQGELVGVGIQGNKYKKKDVGIYFFNLFFVGKGYADLAEFIHWCIVLETPHVPIIDWCYPLSNSIPELVEMSKGMSAIGDTIREGIVIRPLSEVVDHDLHCQLVRNRISFKSVNPEFLLKYE